MFSTLVLIWVGGEVNSTDVVTINNGGSAKMAAKLTKQLTIANKPLQRHWPQRDTQPQHSNGTLLPDAWKTMKQRCHQGTQHTRRWSSECLDILPNQHQSTQ
jgi:hypothetical protein